MLPNVKYNMVQCGATHRLLSRPPRPHLHSLHASLHQKQTNRKQSASGVIDEERHRKQRRRNVRGYSILTSCLNNPSTPDALISLSDSNRPSGILQLLRSFNNNSWASGIVLLIREGEEKLGVFSCLKDAFYSSRLSSRSTCLCLFHPAFLFSLPKLSCGQHHFL